MNNGIARLLSEPIVASIGNNLNRILDVDYQSNLVYRGITLNRSVRIYWGYCIYCENGCEKCGDERYCYIIYIDNSVVIVYMGNGLNPVVIKHYNGCKMLEIGDVIIEQLPIVMTKSARK
jgi:hypothetical protein